MAKYYENSVTDNQEIVCPYCEVVYPVTPEDTYINNKEADCYTDGKEQTFRCECCKKRFKMTPHLSWSYTTETIKGECLEKMQPYLAYTI